MRGRTADSIAIGIVSVLVATLVVLGLSRCSNAYHGEPEERPVATEGGRFGHIGLDVATGIVVDSETGVQYLVVTNSFGTPRYVGITVLLDADGKPMLAEEER